MNLLQELAFHGAELSEARIRTILSTFDIGIDLRNMEHDGQTALMYACTTGDLMTARNLVKCGADPTLKNPIGNNIAHYASMNGHPNILQWIHSELSDLQLCLQPDNLQQWNIAHYAAWKGHLNVLQWISNTYPHMCLEIEKNCDYNIAHWAAFHGHLDIIQWISNEYPQLLFDIDQHGRLPREISALNRVNPKVTDYLLDWDRKYHRKEAMVSLLLGTLKQNDSSPIHKAYFHHWACEYQLLPLIMKMYM